MIYLVEIDGLDEVTGQLVTRRFGSRAYTTRPDDDPPNATFLSRLKDPGNYERHLFGEGRTFGEGTVGAGEVVLVNTDGRLDGISDLALDGRELRIFSLPRVNSRWSTRTVVLRATMEQASFNGREVAVRLRDRLELLREPIQTASYLGTTIKGGMTVAEGNKDLKDTKKAQLWGEGWNISPVLVDQFDNIYHLGTNTLAVVSEVRDGGVKLTPTRDWPTLAALKAAPMQIGQYATCLAEAFVRPYARPDGTLTVYAAEGASAADRSPARVARRMLAALAPVVEADFDALHAAAPDRCGLWLPPGETTVLAAATAILQSIGGFLTADRFGRLRVGRLLLPSGPSKGLLTRNRIIERGEGFARLPTNDLGDGVPAWRVTVRYARNWTTFNEGDLKEVDATDEFRTFAGTEFRQVVVEDASVKARHPRAAEMVFVTYLLDEAAARREAERLLATHSRRRDRFSVVQASTTVQDIDLNDCVTLQLPRYGLDAGRLLRVLGTTPTFKSNLTTLELWG